MPVCQVSVSSSLHILLTISEKKNFEYIFENSPFMSPCQPIKSSDLDKSRMKHGGLLNKHFCKKNNQSRTNGPINAHLTIAHV